MTTIFKGKATCGICGEKSEFDVIGSTNAFGSMDLDTMGVKALRDVMWPPRTATALAPLWATT